MVLANCVTFEDLGKPEIIRDHQKLSVYAPSIHASFSGLVEDVGKMATSTILSVVHGSHENTSTALFNISTCPII